MKKAVDDRLLAAIDRLARSSSEVANALSTMLSKQDIANEHLRKLVTAAEMYGLPRTNHSLFRTLSAIAQEQAIEIIRTEMAGAVFFADHDEFRFDALSKAGTGAALEFGVYSGYTIGAMAERFPERQFYGFDSFNGLPERWKGYLPVDFDREGKAPDVPENVELIVGLFDETIPVFAQRELPVAFIHVDCDIYSSTKSIFTGLKSQIRPGCIIVFDEYFNYVGFEKHERLAFDEFIRETNYGVDWISYSGQQAACLLTSGAEGHFRRTD
ncbi:class I SAM-dependent methyltransferase [Bradyrhizobium pachyrhizi]|uniref:class I SAM-dependent methyltransferase n=1 Tax=Bradyrhizobium pachyrhizi TaxID=280333 RepID=UPI0024B13EBD|nr:class I SAM-dependent methyltransferase [Bradyrhizobium pachyrhizi]WFU54552.1 class I SAM-dependent methyltransferase [Bradyrhizobium pachyrhizi]